MMTQERSDFTALIAQIYSEAENLKKDRHTLDVARYIEGRFPLRFPNKGLQEFIAEGRVIEIHHEALVPEQLFAEIQHSNSNLETWIDYFGNTHQRDYCYIVLGHRFDDQQVIQLRGLLGENRMHKTLLMLALAGFPQAQIRVIDHAPDYLAITREDLESVSTDLDLIAVGGVVVGGRSLDGRYTCEHRFSGQIISGKVFRISNCRVLMTTFPYGDLSFHATRALLEKFPKRIIFTGAAGSLTPRLGVGQIFSPTEIADESGTIVRNEVNQSLLSVIIQQKLQIVHGNISTPLLETEEKIRALVERGITTIDVEVLHFYRACLKFLQTLADAGVILYVSDVIGAVTSLSQVNFSNLRVARNQIVEVIETLCADANENR